MSHTNNIAYNSELFSHNVQIKYFLDKAKLSKYNILYLNINSINNKLDHLEDLISDIGNIHIIALTEIRIFMEQNVYFNLPNYNVFFNNRSDGEGGIALYIHNALSTRLILNVCDNNVHYLLVNIAELSINVALIYKQPSANHDILINCIYSILGVHKRVILLGDMNTDLLRSNPKSEQYTNAILGHGFSILNKLDPHSATRIGTRHYENYGTRISRTIIDHAITDLHNFKFSLSLNSCNISDHKLMVLGFDNNSQHKIDFISQWSTKEYKLIDTNKYIEKFESINWDNVVTFDQLLQATTNCRDESITVIRKRVKTNPHKKWVNEELLSLIEERNRYHRLIKKCRNNEYLRSKHSLYCEAIKQLRRKLRYQSNSYNINKNKYEPRKLWCTINEILANKSTSREPIKTIKHNGTTHSTPEHIANTFSTYFCDVGSDLYAQIPINNEIIQNTVPYRTNTMVLFPTTPQEIISKIGSMKKNNSIFDTIPSSCMISLSSSLAPILSRLINNSFETGDFPSGLKLARIIPLFKGADPVLLENYRPISILANTAKLIEMLIYDRLNKFCNKYNIINSNQFGFQKNSSTASAVTSIVEFLQLGLDKGKNSIGACLFIDLKKAFDTIPHSLLIDKLDRMGIRGPINILLKSYLFNRSHYVDIEGVHSNEITNRNPFATPQGSVLGPLLFLLFINDVFNLNLHGKMVLFADDSTIAYTGTDANDLNNKIRGDIELLQKWFEKNKLTLNISKTKLLPIRMNAVDQNFLKIKIDNKYIELVNSFNFLGITLQSDLKWDKHIKYLSRKLYSVAGVAKRLGNKVDDSVLLSIYYSLVYSHLSYLAPVYGTSLSQYDLSKLQVAQNVAIRGIFSNDYYIKNLSTDEIFAKYNIMKIQALISFVLGMWMYKREHNLMKFDLSSRLFVEQHNYPTRNRLNIVPSSSRTNLARNSVYNSGTRLYNSLDNQYKLQPSIHKFKTYLRNFCTLN